MEQHMRLPIDTVAVRFVTAGPAEPVLDYESRAQKVDESGQSLFSVHLFAVAPGSRRDWASSLRSRSRTSWPRRGKPATVTVCRSGPTRSRPRRRRRSNGLALNCGGGCSSNIVGRWLCDCSHRRSCRYWCELLRLELLSDSPPWLGARPRRHRATPGYCRWCRAGATKSLSPCRRS
jgi:hypothetical protein